MFVMSFHSVPKSSQHDRLKGSAICLTLCQVFINESKSFVMLADVFQNNVKGQKRNDGDTGANNEKWRTDLKQAQ